jgi:hypothetical protein
MRLRKVVAIGAAVLMGLLGAVIVPPVTARADDEYHEYQLTAGDYRIDVANTGDIGAYSFSWSG